MSKNLFRYDTLITKYYLYLLLLGDVKIEEK